MPEPDIPEDASSSDFDALVSDLRFDLRNVRRSFNRVVLVEWLQFRTRAVNAGITAALFLGLLGFLLAALVLSAAFIANGIRESLGNLGAGFAILGFLAAVGLAVRILARTRGARRAKRALEERGLDLEEGDES